MWAAVTLSSQGKMGSRSADIRRVDLSGGHPLGGGGGYPPPWNRSMPQRPPKVAMTRRITSHRSPASSNCHAR